jgi:hypothetical protein
MFLALREWKEDMPETGWEGGIQEDRTGYKTAWTAIARGGGKDPEYAAGTGCRGQQGRTE